MTGITLFTVLIFATFSTGAGIFSCCKSGTQPGVGALWDCRRCGLKSIPPDPPKNVRAVSLEANEISRIPKGSFRTYHNVIWLNLQNNSLNLLNGTVNFDDMPQLEYLCLARNPIILNYLNAYHSDIFKSLSNLKELDVYRVEYNKIDDRHFEEYPGKYLAPLVNLNFAVLPPVSFEKFGNYFMNSTKLQSLSLIGSMPGAKKVWTVMKNETFENLPHLESLYLIDSSLEKIESHAFHALRNLKEIEVSCSTLEAIQLLKAIENLPRPSLQTLFFDFDKSVAVIQRNKSFELLSNLSRVVMTIPVVVPHPNPFIENILPIFWESVRDLEIIRPYTNAHVSAVYRNADPGTPDLRITISSTVKDMPYLSACSLTSSVTKVNEKKQMKTFAQQDSINLTDTQLFQANATQMETAHYSGRNLAAEKQVAKFTALARKFHLLKRKRRSSLHNSSISHTKFATKVSDNIGIALAEPHPSCKSGSYSPKICSRLFSLTITFCFSYVQSQVLDLIVRQGQSLGISVELLSLYVNELLYNSLPGDPILQNVEELIPQANLLNLDSRNMPRLKRYDISGNYIQDLCHTDALRRLHSLEIFNASNNDLNCINQYSFINAPNLTHVDLSQNDLQTVSLDISHLKQLQSIDLSKNQIQYFLRSFMDQISNSSKVHIDLSGNSLVCYCGPEYISFISWMKSHPGIFEGFENYTCWDIHGNIWLIKELEISAYENACRSKLPIYIAVTVSGGLAAIIIMSLGYQHRWRVMWYAYNIKTCFRSRQRKPSRYRPVEYEPINSDPRTGETYDIFLAYAQENSDIMSPVLESLISRGFSASHPDGFEWGKSMFEESVIAIQQSEKTVFLVTKAFAQCRICNFQLQMALINGKENIVLLQMDLMSELNSAGMEPVLRRLLQSDGALEYHDNECFWQTFESKLRS